MRPHRTKGGGVVQLILIVVLLAAQLFASLFYVSTALVMWGPFMAAPPSAKAFVTVIVLAPLLSLLVAYGRVRIPKTGTLATVGLITLAQAALVFAAAMTSGS